MNILYSNKPKRFFSFGCSFTNYCWLTWPDIIAFELGCDYYNFGRAGAGNSYITNMVCQVDQYFKFDKDDLVIICWSGIQREDRYKRGRWHTAGNVHSNDNTIWSEQFAKVIADDCHFLMRDLANIKLVYNLLKDKTQFHFLSMDTIKKSMGLRIKRDNYINLIKLYMDVISYINPSFEEVLWNGNAGLRKPVHKHYSDDHPTPLEHFTYLKNIFDYDFSDEVNKKINYFEKFYINLVNDVYSNIKKTIHPCDEKMPKHLKDRIDKGYSKIKIVESLPLPRNLIV